MVLPWVGFPLSKVLQAVEPTSAAQYVRLEALHAPERLPGQRGGLFKWPYVEGLRLDEARRRTLMFNGYEDQVAHLYRGMDLTRWL